MDLANEIELEVLNYLQGLAGFDNWWDSVDSDIQGQIETALIDIIKLGLDTTKEG